MIPLLDNEPASEDNRRFLDIVVFIAVHVRQLWFLGDFFWSFASKPAFIRNDKNRDSPQRPHTASLQNQRGLSQWLAYPAHRKCAEDMSVRNDEHIALRAIRVLEAGAVIFFLDIGNQCVETTDDVFGGSGETRYEQLILCDPVTGRTI